MYLPHLNESILNTNASPISRTTNWGNYFDMLVKESAHENSNIRGHAIKKLREVLKTEGSHVEKYIVDRGYESIQPVMCFCVCVKCILFFLTYLLYKTFCLHNV